MEQTYQLGKFSTSNILWSSNPDPNAGYHRNLEESLPLNEYLKREFPNASIVNHIKSGEKFPSIKKPFLLSNDNGLISYMIGNHLVTYLTKDYFAIHSNEENGEKTVAPLNSIEFK